MQPKSPRQAKSAQKPVTSPALKSAVENLEWAAAAAQKTAAEAARRLNPAGLPAPPRYSRGGRGLLAPLFSAVRAGKPENVGLTGRANAAKKALTAKVTGFAPVVCPAKGNLVPERGIQYSGALTPADWHSVPGFDLVEVEAALALHSSASADERALCAWAVACVFEARPTAKANALARLREENKVN